MLTQPVDLVFNDLLTPEQTHWVSTSAIPFRKITFHRGSDRGGAFGWDPSSTLVFAGDSCLAASRETLQVSPSAVLEHFEEGVHSQEGSSRMTGPAQHISSFVSLSD